MIFLSFLLIIIFLYRILIKYGKVHKIVTTYQYFGNRGIDSCNKLKYLFCPSLNFLETFTIRHFDEGRIFILCIRISGYCTAQSWTFVPSNSPKSISIKPFSSNIGVEGWKTFIRRAVSSARIRGLVYIAIRGLFFRANTRALTWFLPSWFSDKLLLSWNRRTLFHSLSPCRTR